MIFSKSTYNRVNIYSMIVAALLLILFSIIGIVEYRQSEREMREKLPQLFEQAINEQIKSQLKNVDIHINVASKSLVGEDSIRNQTIITEDTIITREAKVERDFNKSFLRNSQTYLLHQNRLQPDTLQQIFNTKLEENNLKVHAVIVIRLENEIKVSGDTAQYRFNYRMPVVKGGVFEEISYEGLIDYSPFTVFRLISKSMLIVLFVLELLVLGLIIYLYIKKSKIKPNKIMKKGEYYYIGEVIFDTRKWELTGKKKQSISVPRQQAEILLMFLESDNHALLKEEIKNRYWAQLDTANQSLMSTINKLRKNLQAVGCTFTIRTNKGDSYYILQYEDEDCH